MRAQASRSTSTNHQRTCSQSGGTGTIARRHWADGSRSRFFAFFRRRRRRSWLLVQPQLGEDTRFAGIYLHTLAFSTSSLQTLRLGHWAPAATDSSGAGASRFRVATGREGLACLGREALLINSVQLASQPIETLTTHARARDEFSCQRHHRKWKQPTIMWHARWSATDLHARRLGVDGFVTGVGPAATMGIACCWNGPSISSLGRERRGTG